MFIENAYAQEAASQAFDIMGFVPFILVFILFYFMLIRPQQNKMKQHQLLINNLKKGDKVVTNSGIIGVIKKISEQNNMLSLEIAQNIEIEMHKNYIQELYNKG